MVMDGLHMLIILHQKSGLWLMNVMVNHVVVLCDSRKVVVVVGIVGSIVAVGDGGELMMVIDIVVVVICIGGRVVFRRRLVGLLWNSDRFSVRWGEVVHVIHGRIVRCAGWHNWDVHGSLRLTIQLLGLNWMVCKLCGVVVRLLLVVCV